MASKSAVITKVAREKLVKARSGAATLSPIKGMAFGKGGLGSDGKPVIPTEDQTELGNEILRKEVDGYEMISSTTCRYTCTLDEDEASGENINEIALYDTDGDLVCIKTFTNKGKDEDMKLIFTIDDIM